MFVLLPRCASSITLPTPVAFRKGSSELDLAKIHTQPVHSGTFLCCYRRCYLITKISDNQIRSASARQKETKRRYNARADTT
uniref:Uncharacterized protein n=2 Tax=Canis lupus familiaris TaxID=9615 RepID=A0A8C0TP39_CANLF